MKIVRDNIVCVDMGEPNFKPDAIPFYSKTEKKMYAMQFYNQLILFGVVSIGNPHCVIQVKDINNIDVRHLGAAIENHNLFPNRVNVNFMQIVQKDQIIIRVYERGTGETLSCGSGACASVAVGILQGLLSERVSVKSKGGILNINWKGPGNSIYMTGPATHVYDGYIDL